MFFHSSSSLLIFINFSIYYQLLSEKRSTMSKEINKKLSRAPSIFSQEPSNHYCLCIEIAPKGEYRPLLETVEHDKLYMAIENKLTSLLGTKSVSRISQNFFIVLKAFPTIEPMESLEKITHQKWITNMLSHVLQELIDTYDSKNIFLSRVTIGTATSGILYHTETFEELIELAHFTEFTAKEKKLPYLIADEKIKAKKRDIDEFKAALQQKQTLSEFSPFFQPIIDLKKQTIIGCESYARWQKDTYRIIGAAKFKDIAYEMDLLEKIDRVIIDKALSSMSTLKKKNLVPDDFFIVLNISAMTIFSFTVNEFIKLAQKYNINPKYIEFDVKDKHMSNQNLSNKIKEFRDAGIKIALDAFNIEAFDFESFLLGEFDTIKIDFSSIDKKSSAIEKHLEFYSSLSSIAQNLKIKTVAKGIENRYQLSCARQIGVEHAQGHYFLKPLSEDKFSDYLQTYISGLELSVMAE